MDVDLINYQIVSQTLRAWRHGQESPPGLLALDALHSDRDSSPVEKSISLQDLIHAVAAEELNRQRKAEELPPLTTTTLSKKSMLEALSLDFKVSNTELQAWSALYYRFLCPVPFTVDVLASAIPTDPRHFRRRLTYGVKRLTERIQRAEQTAHERALNRRRSRFLPPTEYARLFGIYSLKGQICTVLRAVDGPRFLSIEGLGGIGKTALARGVAFDLAQNSDFEGIAWISARQTWLSDRGAIEETTDAATSLADIVSRLATQLGLEQLAGLSTSAKIDRLHAYLAERHYLIVIDNLESVSDIADLLPTLSLLGGSARFLLTSRQALSSYPTVHRRMVPPLSISDSRALFESELARHGHPQHIVAENMTRLYGLVGGMPLAIKLVAAQAFQWPLDVILDDLGAAERRAPEQLYTFIYQRTWLALDDNARQLLLSMLTISPDGEDIDWLRLFSALEADRFDNALQQLLDYSLLEAAGDITSPTYRLHRLTVTFLQTEIITGWHDTPSTMEP